MKIECQPWSPCILLIIIYHICGDAPSYHCRCQLCHTLGGTYLTAVIEDLMKKMLIINALLTTVTVMAKLSTTI